MTTFSTSIPAFIDMLGALSGFLDKAGDDKLLEARLAPDMLPLASQIRIACDQITGAMRRLTGTAIANPDDNDTTLAGAKARIATMVAWLSGLKESDFPADDKRVTLDLPNGMAFEMSAAEHLRDWTLPQFYFHVSIAYAILRNQNVALGKTDLMPFMMRYMTKPPTAASV